MASETGTQKLSRKGAQGAKNFSEKKLRVFPIALREPVKPKHRLMPSVFSTGSGALNKEAAKMAFDFIPGNCIHFVANGIQLAGVLQVQLDTVLEAARGWTRLYRGFVIRVMRQFQRSFGFSMRCRLQIGAPMEMRQIENLRSVRTTAFQSAALMPLQRGLAYER